MSLVAIENHYQQAIDIENHYQQESLSNGTIFAYPIIGMIYASRANRNKEG
jgi:hypothetical protein